MFKHRGKFKCFFNNKVVECSSFKEAFKHLYDYIHDPSDKFSKPLEEVEKLWIQLPNQKVIYWYDCCEAARKEGFLVGDSPVY